jgi:hypothetical protein
MWEYVCDKDGVSWRKDAFTKNTLSYDGDTIYAWTNSSDDNDAVEFDSFAWENPEFTHPIVIPESQPYFCVESWLSPSGELHHLRYPVIAWLYDGKSVAPLTPNRISPTSPLAILHPKGEVFQNGRLWPSLVEYVAARDAAHRKRGRHHPASLEMRAARKADAAQAAEPI